MEPNYSWQGMFISGFKALDSHLIVQHDDPISDDEIEAIKIVVDIANQRYQSELDELKKLTEGLN